MQLEIFNDEARNLNIRKARYLYQTGIAEITGMIIVNQFKN